MTKDEIKLIKERFIRSTQRWYDSLHPDQKKDPMCLMCGVIPDNLVKLSEALAAEAHLTSLAEKE